MKGKNNLKTIKDYYDELEEVKKQIRITTSPRRKNDLQKYRAYLVKEIDTYAEFKRKKPARKEQHNAEMDG